MELVLVSATAHSPQRAALDCAGGFGTVLQRAEEDSGDTKVTTALSHRCSSA